MDLQTALMGAGGGGHFRQGASIGKSLFGGSQDAYDKSYQRAATVENTMLDARKKRDEAMAIDQQARAFEEAGQSEMARALRGGFAKDMGQIQEQGFRQGAYDAGLRRYGEDNPNAHLFGVASSPQAMPQTMGQGAYVSDRFDPETAVELSEIGRALVGASNARAGASGAQAGASNARVGASAAQADASTARAELLRVQAAAGGWNPNTGKGGKGKKPQGKTKVSAAAVKALWDNPQMAGQFKEKFGTAAFDAVMAQRP